MVLTLYVTVNPRRRLHSLLADAPLQIPTNLSPITDQQLLPSIEQKKTEEEAMENLQSWVSDHKLTSIGTVWASAVGASLSYNSWSRSPLKPSLRLIHARLHAQALTLAVLSGAAAYHYFEKRAGVGERRDTT